jgi:curved DNA-binding protein CbpA
MSAGADLYAVLGLKKECTDAELRVAYRRLAMIWHPDRCAASGSSARVKEAKERFQEIQGAYSVLSDSNKRFLYDVGVYDDEDDQLSGMGDFLGEMADMMSQATPTESFEELQQLFVDMFQDDIMAGICGGPRPGQCAQSRSAPPCQPSSPSRPRPARTSQRTPPSCNGFSKRGSSAMGSGKPSWRPGRAGLSPGLGLSGFCFKVSETRQRPAPRGYHMSGGGGRSCTKQRLSTSRDVSDDGFSRQSRTSCQ